MIDRAELDRWMAAAAEGDRAAVDPLFHALWPAVVGYATRLVGDRQLAEDCAQDALVQLFRQLGDYDRSRDALTWALTITTWRCRTARRERARHAARTAPDALEAVDGRSTSPTGSAGGSIDGAALIERRDLVRSALAALDGLAPADLEAITIALTGADAPHLSPATLRKRLERALARLRTSWRSRHGTL